MPYIDANVFIYPVLYEEQNLKAKNSKRILLSIEKGELSAYTSTLTWDEVVWTVRKTLGRDQAIDQGKKLLGFLNLQWIVVDDHVLSQAQALLAKYNLHPRDSIHVASAIDRKIENFISDDADIDRVKEIKREPLL
jgi:hypothetical protein